MASNNSVFVRAVGVLALIGGLSACDALRDVSVEEYLERATGHQAKGSPQAAVIELKNALQKEPQSVEARLHLGTLYFDMGDMRNAQKELEHAAALGAEAAAVAPLLIQSLLQLNEVEAALQVLREAALAAPLAHPLRAQAHFARQETSEGCRLAARDAESTLALARITRAHCALHDNRGEAARAELDAVLEDEPHHLQALLLKARVQLARDDLEGAEHSYSAVLARVPGRLEARAGRTAVRLGLGRLEGAEADLRALRHVAPRHVTVARLEGVLASARAQSEDAALAFERALTMAPTHAPTLLHAGLAHHAAGQYEQALQRLQQYVREETASAPRVNALVAMLQARRGAHGEARAIAASLSGGAQSDAVTLATLGNTYRLLGDGEQAVAHLRRAVEAAPEAGNARLQLASALLQAGDASGAVLELEHADALDTGTAQSIEVLVQGYLSAGDYPAAMKALDRLEAIDPKNPAVGNYRGIAHLLQNELADAERYFRGTLKRAPDHSPTAINLARVVLVRGEVDEGRALLEGVVKREPHHVPARLLLAALERHAQRPAQARAHLERAVETAPHLPDPALALARDYMAMAQPQRAFETANRAAEHHPEHLGLLEVQGLAAQASGRSAEALRAFERLVALAPEVARAHHYLARVHMAAQAPEAARKSLARVLELEPANLGAQREAAALALQANDLSAAESLGKALRANAPETAYGHLVQAQVRNARGDRAGALAILDQAPAIDGDSVVSVARMRWLLNDRESAVAKVQAWQREHAQDRAVLEFLGDAHISLGDEAHARDAYAALAVLAPDDARVLNNLAWLSRTTEPAAALRYAERARSLAPDDAAVLDTYGWIRHEQGDSRRAREALARAHELAPDEALIQYHYAAVLARAGDKAKARALLERALAAPNFSAAPDARALLETL